MMKCCKSITSFLVQKVDRTRSVTCRHYVRHVTEVNQIGMRQICGRDITRPRKTRRGCVIPNPSIEAVLAGVSVSGWHAKRSLLERIRSTRSDFRRLVLLNWHSSRIWPHWRHLSCKGDQHLYSRSATFPKRKCSLGSPSGAPYQCRPPNRDQVPDAHATLTDQLSRPHG